MAFLNPEFLVSAARATTFMQPRSDYDFYDDPPGLDDDRVLDSAVAAPRSWDAKFVLRCGFLTYYNSLTKHSSWPLPVHLTTPELALFGQAHGILREVPQCGDIFLQWNVPGQRFIHCGVVGAVGHGFSVGRHVTSIDAHTIEGDTDEALRLRGGQVKRGIRTMSPFNGDRFLRWWLIEGEDVQPEHELIRRESRSA